MEIQIISIPESKSDRNKVLPFGSFVSIIFRLYKMGEIMQLRCYLIVAESLEVIDGHKQQYSLSYKNHIKFNYLTNHQLFLSLDDIWANTSMLRRNLICAYITCENGAGTRHT